MALQTAVFLDRDNTIIVNSGDLGDPEAVKLLPGVAQAIADLRQGGYRLVVVTNQGGVARGQFTEADVDAVHQRIAALLRAENGLPSGGIERFYYCPFHPEGTVDEYRRDHPWRKPQPGMLLQAARDMGIDLGTSWMVGDQPRDVQAGAVAGCQTILIDVEGKGPPDDLDATGIVTDLAEAAAVILQDVDEAEPAVEMPATQAVGTVREVAAPTRKRTVTEAAPPASARPRLNTLWQRHEEVADEVSRLRDSVADLTEEFRHERAARGEFTALRMAAILLQLLVILLALLGLMQLHEFSVFMRWMVAAVLVQGLVIAALLLDR